jgi:NitT/TauT family transport system permease protein
MSTSDTLTRERSRPAAGEVESAAFADPPTLGRRNVVAVVSEEQRDTARKVGRAAASVLRSSVALLAFVAVWELAPRLGLADPVFLPPASEVATTFAGLVADGTIPAQIGTSLARAGTGFLLAVVVAIPAGLVIGWYARAAQYLSPFFELFRNTAALALLPVFILVLGIGETSKVAIVVYACFFPLLLSTITGVRTVDPLLVRAARSLGLGSAALFAKVVLPSAVPTIFTGVRMAATGSILVLIAAEMVGAKAGLGYYITFTQFNFQIPEMYAGIVTIALVGVSVNAALVLLERRLQRWRA